MNTVVFIMLFTLLFNEPISVDPTENTRDVTRAKTCYHTSDDGIREKHERHLHYGFTIVTVFSTQLGILH